MVRQNRTNTVKREIERHILEREMTRNNGPVFIKIAIVREEE